MNRLEPKATHTPKCFDATLEVASENPETVVVHGWTYGNGRWILHAWCESADAVIDLTESRSPIPKSDFYEVMGVSEERTRRYSRLEFFTLAAQEGHFGPFDKSFFFTETTQSDPIDAERKAH